MIPETPKSNYEMIRHENIEEREAQFQQIFGHSIDLSYLKY